jgi:hypothetical protein
MFLHPTEKEVLSVRTCCNETERHIVLVRIESDDARKSPGYNIIFCGRRKGFLAGGMNFVSE